MNLVDTVSSTNVAADQVRAPYLARPMLIDYLTVCHELPPDQRDQWAAFHGSDFVPDQAAAQLAAAPGLRWALIEPNGSPLMVGGFQSEMMPLGVWQDWLLSTERAWAEYPKASTRACRQMLNVMFESGARRVQGLILAERNHVRAWYRLIGYEFEGILHGRCADGRDAVIYARVRQS